MKRMWIRGLMVASALVALPAAGVGAVMFVEGLPSVAGQIPSTPMLVTLGLPLDGSAAGVGSPVPVSAQAAAPHPVVRMELWADGAPVSSFVPVSVGPNQYRGSAAWTPGAAGEHALVVRAIDDQGRVGVSNAVRVEALLATESMRMEPVVAQGGETLDDLAATYGTTVEAILTYDDSLAAGQGLEPGREVWIPVPSSYTPPMVELPPAPSAPAGGEAAVPPMAPLVFWLQATFLPPPASPPAAPGLTAGAQGCGAALSIEDQSNDETGFFVYRQGPSDVGFERIAALGPHAGDGAVTFSDTDLSGAYLYYAAAFNRAGESAGPVARVAVAGECAREDWSGEMRLEGGLLRSPVAADRAYFYASVNGGSWVRVPADPHAFLPAVQGGYAAGDYLADLAAGAGGPVTTLSLDGWGWGGGALAYLGHGQANYSTAQPAEDAASLYLWTALQGAPLGILGGDPSLVEKSFSDEFGFATPRNFLFRWKTGASPTTGRWQVSRSPYFLPAAILAEGVTDLKPGWNGHSYFNIPFDDLLALTANIGDQPAAPLLGGPVLPGSEPALSLGSDQGVVLNSPFLPGLGVGGAQGAGWDAPAAFSGLSPVMGMGGAPNEYYVRITPMIGNQVAGEVSNTVVVRHNPEGQPSDIKIPTLGSEFYTPLYELKVLDYVPGALEDPNKWGCVEFVKVEPGTPASWAFGVGDVHCPASFKGDGYQGWKGVEKAFDTVVGWLKGGMSAVSEFWGDLKEFAVKVILKYTPLGLQCQFAENVALPEGTCHTVFAAAVDIGLASMGVPPTIPDFDQLMEQGVDYAVELAAQEVLEASPVPCVGPCEDAVKYTIRKTLETAIEQAANQSIAPSCVSEDEAHQNGREPWCPPAGAVVKPALAAVDSPPTVLLRVTRRPDVPDPANIPACTLVVGAEYTYHEGPPGHPAPKGNPFYAKYLPIPPLAPGESFQVAVALTDRSIVDFPWDLPYSGSHKFHHWPGMVFYGTSHAYAGASFVTPAYVYGTPSPCALEVTGSEENSPNSP